MQMNLQIWLDDFGDSVGSVESSVARLAAISEQENCNVSHALLTLKRGPNLD